MNTYTMRTRNIPLQDVWDVIVVGGGPAGCTAAAAAAREGASTLLIEATGALGGMGTSGLVQAWCPFTDKEKIIYGGFAERILKKSIDGMPHVPKDQYDWTPIDAEQLKRIYDDLVTEHGVTVLFNSFLATVESDQRGVIDALIVSNKAGLTAYKARIYVDCTGDGDLAAWAGAEFQKGNESGELQAATHCFVLTNVDEYGYRHGVRLHNYNPDSPIGAIIEDGKYPEIIDRHLNDKQVGPGAVGFNAGHIWDVDNTRPESVSSAMMQGRRIAHAFRRALAEYHPEAFANAWLASTGSLMGIRETRRIVGDYMLTADDYDARRSFDDEICRNSYYLDVHCRITDPHLKKEAASGRMGPGESHGIPYRCLTPRGMKNLLVAGRSISTDRAINGSTRVMPVCLAMGEAAGIAAAMAAQEDIPDTRSVDTVELRNRLRAYGAYLPGTENGSPTPQGRRLAPPIISSEAKESRDA